MKHGTALDVMIPAVRRCLNSCAIAAELNRCINWPDGFAVSAVRVRRFTPRPNDCFDFEYSVDLSHPTGGDDQTVALWGRCPPLPDDRNLRSATAILTPRGVSCVHTDCPSLQMTFHSMDRDPAFPQFDQCLDGVAMMQRIDACDTPGASCMRGSVTPPMLECEIATFRRGRRFVVRYFDDQAPLRRAWSGKCYANDRGNRLVRQHRLIAEYLDSIEGGRVRVPRLLGHAADLRMVITEWRCTSLPTRYNPPATLYARRAAEVLAALQSAPPGGLRTADPERYWNVMENWCDWIESLDPSLADEGRRLLGRLREARKRLHPCDAVVTHGDFYEAQLIIDEDETTLLDLDTVAVGDRCTDIGNYLAHQYLTCLENDHATQQYASLASMFLREYESVAAPVDDAALAYYWAATLYRAGAIHLFRDRTSRYAESLWRMVEPVLERGRRLLDELGAGIGPPADGWRSAC